MKKLLILILMLVPFIVFGQVVEPVEPFFKSIEFWIAVATGVLFVIEWIARAVPTNKTWGFIIKAAIWFLKWIIERVDDKKKGGGTHE
jgi:hypothetical protein